ncbi:hypothetical protein QVD17_20999 [Tagetes erecta]|uniref:Uncharacterized protein n=1 Tax=Tagetes erecta TaxID=13708 RepID=A0AAD8NYL0_TARER|nr:hypothetical protein QVD17_20999 [Tagetes erecta]
MESSSQSEIFDLYYLTSLATWNESPHHQYCGHLIACSELMKECSGCGLKIVLKIASHQNIFIVNKYDFSTYNRRSCLPLHLKSVVEYYIFLLQQMDDRITAEQKPYVTIKLTDLRVPHPLTGRLQLKSSNATYVYFNPRTPKTHQLLNL